MNQSSATSRRRASPQNSAASRVAVISSGWHRDIIVNALTAIKKEFKAQGFPARNLDFFEVPGAFEIPLHAQRLAESGRYDGIIACGFVVDGGIYRHEFVASAVIDGLMRVQLDSGVPVFSSVLTPKDFHEHEDHLKFFATHFVIKGAEVARACLATLASLAKLPEKRS